MIKRFCMTLFRLVVCFAVLFMSAGTCYADPSGGFEVPEVNEDFTKVKPNQGAQQKKDENTWLGDFLIWIGAAKDKKDLEKLSKQANDEFLDGFFKKSVESLLGYDLYTGDPLQGERKKEADRALSSVVDCIPVISNIKNWKDLFTGKDSISGDKLSPVDKVISAIGIASGPGKKAGVILKGIFNGGKKLLKKFGVYIDDLAERFGFGPKLQPAGGPPDIPRKPEVNRIEGTNGGGGSKGTNKSVKEVPVSSEKMYQLGKHFNKHGRQMGFASKKEYDQAAKDFAKKYQNDPKAEIWEGVWNGKGNLNGKTQRAIIYNDKTVILDPVSGQVIDFYQGTRLGGLIHLKKLR
jgi:hypothetical protein